jgi:hypothetical protein
MTPQEAFSRVIEHREIFHAKRRDRLLTGRS